HSSDHLDDQMNAKSFLFLSYPSSYSYLLISHLFSRISPLTYLKIISLSSIYIIFSTFILIISLTYYTLIKIVPNALELYSFRAFETRLFRNWNNIVLKRPELFCSTFLRNYKCSDALTRNLKVPSVELLSYGNCR